MLDIPAGRWEGLDGLSDEAIEELRPKAEHTVKRALVYAEGEVKQTLTGPRSGRAYQVSQRGPLHIASAPGEAPAVLFGNLRNSVGHNGPAWDGLTVGGEFGVGLGVRLRGRASKGDQPSYALRLEFGGVHTVRETVRVRIDGQWRTVKAGTVIRILPRPYMEPTVQRIAPVIERMFEEGV